MHFPMLENVRIYYCSEDRSDLCFYIVWKYSFKGYKVENFPATVSCSQRFDGSDPCSQQYLLLEMEMQQGEQTSQHKNCCAGKFLLLQISYAWDAQMVICHVLTYSFVQLVYL